VTSVALRVGKWLKFRAEAYGSRTHPRHRGVPSNGFEDREAHRDLYTSMAAEVPRMSYCAT
jgi:hypothetical protein